MLLTRQYCCLFCHKTSNTAKDTNSCRHLFIHIVDVSLSSHIKFANTMPRYLKVVSQGKAFPRRFRLKSELRSVCLSDVLIINTYFSKHLEQDYCPLTIHS